MTFLSSRSADRPSRFTLRAFCPLLDRLAHADDATADSRRHLAIPAIILNNKRKRRAERDWMLIP